MTISLRAEQQQFTRSRLIAAAWAAFSDVGYTAARADQIAAAAGCSRATFYLYFKSKADIFMSAWISLERDAYLGLLKHLDELDVVDAGALRCWTDGLVSYWEDRRNISLATNQAIALEPALATQWFADIANGIDAMPRFITRIGCRETASARLLLIATQTERLMFMWLMGASPVGRQQLVDLLSGLWGATLNPEGRIE